MNEKLYKDLLNYAQNLISKTYGKFPLTRYDVVHECWDFKSENKKDILNKLNVYFYSELKKRQFSYDSIINEDGSSAGLDVISFSKKKVRQNISLKECKHCRLILSQSKFQQFGKICIDCRIEQIKTYVTKKTDAVKICKICLQEKPINKFKLNKGIRLKSCYACLYKMSSRTLQIKKDKDFYKELERKRKYCNLTEKEITKRERAKISNEICEKTVKAYAKKRYEEVEKKDPNRAKKARERYERYRDRQKRLNRKL